MYFPFIRGRQYDLLAIRELFEQKLVSDKVCPIIEPINSQAIVALIKSCQSQKRQISVVFNPIVGDLTSGLGDDLVDLIIHSECITPCFYFSKKTESFIVKIRERTKDPLKTFGLLLDSSFDKDLYLSFLSKIGKPKWVVAPGGVAFSDFADVPVIVQNDPFKKEAKNSDYPDRSPEVFGSLVTTYSKRNFFGFSDYTIVGGEHMESGFAPMCVAIHIVYVDPVSSVLKIVHFLSRDDRQIQDIAGKFGEAVQKFAVMNKAVFNNLTYSERQIESFYENGRYPGLGLLKKYEIMQCIESTNLLL